MKRLVPLLLAAIAILGAGEPAWAASRIVPHVRTPTWANEPADVAGLPGNLLVTTNCTEPLTAGDLQRDAGELAAFKVDVQPGDTPPGDVGRTPAVQRCEYSWSAFKQNYAEIKSYAASFVVECGSYTSGQQGWILQTHASDDAGDVNPSHPLVAIRLDSMTQVRILYSGSTNGNATITDTTAYTNAAFQCGVEYRYLFEVTPSKVGAGVLDVWEWKEGASAATRVVSLTGIMFGYDDVSGWYLKAGFYGRGGDYPVVVRYRKVFPVAAGTMRHLLLDKNLWR